MCSPGSSILQVSCTLRILRLPFSTPPTSIHVLPWSQTFSLSLSPSPSLSVSLSLSLSLSLPRYQEHVGFSEGLRNGNFFLSQTYLSLPLSLSLSLFLSLSFSLPLSANAITDHKSYQKLRIKTRSWKLSYSGTKEAMEWTWLIRNSWEANCPITFGPL